MFVFFNGFRFCKFPSPQTEKLGSCTQSHDNKIMMAGMTDDDGRRGGSSIDDEW